MEAKFRCLANAATNLLDSSLLTFNSEFLAHLSATNFEFVFKSVLNPIRPSQPKYVSKIRLSKTLD